MCIKRYTPTATELFNLISTDIGRPLADIAPKIEYDAFVDDANEVLGKLVKKEVEVLSHDGRWFSIRIMPYRTLDNVIDGVAATFTDISSLKHAETLRHMATVVEDSFDAVTVQDLDGRITAWNKGAERIYGFSRPEALRMNVSRIIPRDKLKEADEVLERVRAGERIEPFETSRMTKDGRRMDILLKVTKLTDDHGRVVGIATTERNITG